MTTREKQETDAWIAHLEKSIRNSEDAGDVAHAEYLLGRYRKHAIDLKETLQKMHLLDRVTESHLERFRASAGYDVIIDLFGSATHGRVNTVWKRYYEMTSPGSIIISSSIPRGRFSKFFSVSPIGKDPPHEARLFLVERV